MKLTSCFGKTGCLVIAALMAVLFVGCGGNGSGSQNGTTVLPGGGGSGSGTQAIALTQVSRDVLTDSQSQHATEAEPVMAAFTSTVVAAFQVGVMPTFGSADIGFATSTNGGGSWSSGLLPGITIFQGGTFSATANPTIAYDQAHTTWIIAYIAVGSSSNRVLASRSSDGENWQAPVLASFTANAEKPWIACDNNAVSEFHGSCYLVWDDPSNGGLVWLSTSTDGGNTWSAAVNTSGRLAGFGGEPLVSKNGTVIVPIMSSDGTQMLAFTSTNGGASWGASVVISNITDHIVAGNLNTLPLPSAAVDGAGNVYVVWQDCRFRAGCTENDIVLSTSSDGITWTAPAAIPIDGLTTNTVDHFLPALAVNSATSGSSAQLGLTYYYYSDAACTQSTCQLHVGFIASSDGGSNWDTATPVAGPMMLAWLPQSSAGLTVGDYVSTAYINNQPRPIFTLAQINAGTTLSQAIYTTTNPLPQMNKALHRVVPAHAAVSLESDHPPRR